MDIDMSICLLIFMRFPSQWGAAVLGVWKLNCEGPIVDSVTPMFNGDINKK
jgi:hypothetical protein